MSLPSRGRPVPQRPGDPVRRAMLGRAGAAGLTALLAAAGLLPAGDARAQAQAWNAAAFQARSLAEALKALGAGAPRDSRELQISAPDVAENGAVVPVTLRSAIARTDFMALLIERNPNPLAGAFWFLDAAEAEAGVRVKMSQGSDLILLARAEGRFFVARREVTVTVGGCGS